MKISGRQGEIRKMVEKNILPKRPLGKTGEEISILGLGGEGILRTHDEEEKTVPLIRRALDLGITYFEAARAYASSESYYGMALQERRRDIFLSSKSHERTGAGALKHLEVTLQNMKTDFLDLWMVHDVRSPKDVEQIFEQRGAIKAFRRAK